MKAKWALALGPFMHNNKPLLGRPRAFRKTDWYMTSIRYTYSNNPLKRGSLRLLRSVYFYTLPLPFRYSMLAPPSAERTPHNAARQMQNPRDCDLRLR